MGAGTLTKVLISLQYEPALVLRSRTEAVRDRKAVLFDRKGIELPDGIINSIVNAQAAERRGCQLLAIWLKKNKPTLLDELELTEFLPERLR